MKPEQELSWPASLVLTLFLMGSIVVSFVVGYTTSRRFTVCPAQPAEAAQLFGGPASQWHRTSAGWEIGPRARDLVLTAPYGYARIITGTNGDTNLFGASPDRQDLVLVAGGKLELICPSQ